MAGDERQGVEPGLGVAVQADVDRSQSITPQTGRKLNRLIIGVLVIAVGVLLADKFLLRAPDPAPTQASVVEVADTNSVAVLPFVDMSPAKDQEYFTDGLTENLLHALAQIQELKVAGRTSSFAFKGKEEDLRVIGEKLSVAHILEGSVRKAGNRVRVTAQLIDVDTDTHLWSETYTRELVDIFAVQDEIAHAIVSALKLTLSGQEEQVLEQRPTDNIEAYNQYLYGRHWWNQRIPGRMAEAIEPLRKAVELDPRFVQAWAALADVYLLLPEYGEGSVAENIPRALEASQKALALDPDSANATTTYAYIRAMHYYQWEEAEAEFKRAIELSPNYRTAHQWYAEMLAVLRRTDEALAQLDMAAEVDPLAPIIPHIRGWVLLWADRTEEAKQAYLDALRLDPGFPYAVGNLAMTHLRLGEFEQARVRYREIAELLDADPADNLLLVDAMENPAFHDEAIRMLGEVPVPSQPFDVPVMFMMLGEPELALECLERNFEAGGPYAPHINRIDLFDPLRDDPRFQALLAKMNLWP